MDGDIAGRMACLSGCGESWSRETLRGLLSWAAVERPEPDVSSLLGRPYPPATCRICGGAMTVSVRMLVVFDHCSAHGVWLDRNERERFARAFNIRPRLLGS